MNDFTGFFAVAIDGPAGVGKGTLAQNLAEALGFVYVDTGAMYRAVAYFCLTSNVILEIGPVESIIDRLNITVEFKNNSQRVKLNGADVTDKLRTPDVSEASSKVAVIPAVREKLMKLQRKIASENNVVMEGRDIGTRVLPNAQIKIYLDAGIEERARRRLKDRTNIGIHAELGAIERELEERDYRDMRREHSPLLRAGEAVLIDSTYMSPRQVKEIALGIVYDKTGGLYGIRYSQGDIANCIPFIISH